MSVPTSLLNEWTSGLLHRGNNLAQAKLPKATQTQTARQRVNDPEPSARILSCNEIGRVAKRKNQPTILKEGDPIRQLYNSDILSQSRRLPCLGPCEDREERI